MILPVLVINRDRDADRLAAFDRSAKAHAVAYERIAALDAHAPDFPFADHASLIGDHFWGRAEAKPGAIGCFLSHRAAWQVVRDRGLDAALICEDDAVLMGGADALASAQQAMGSADLIFVNPRLAAWAGAITAAPFAPLAEIVPALAARGGPKAVGIKPTPGADAYMIGAAGAARLLDITARQKIICGVDWAMVRNSLGAVTDDIAVAFPELGLLSDMPWLPSPPLVAQVATTPLAGQSGNWPSALRHSVTRPITELLGRQDPSRD